jgi:hypothetical protein
MSWRPDCILALGGDRYRCSLGRWETTVRPGDLPIVCNGCDAPALTDAQRAEAAQRLDLLPGQIPAQLTNRQAAWVAAGMPLRSNWEELWLAPCDHRRPSGMCGKLGCAAGEKGYHVACVWLCKMETADCPAGKWSGPEAPGVATGVTEAE